MEPRITYITNRVRIIETSSDGEWLDGYTVEWAKGNGGWNGYELPPAATFKTAQTIGAALADVLDDLPADRDEAPMKA